MNPVQPHLIQEALRQAVRLDELDLSLYPIEDSERTATELEEVHLMFRANNMIREHLASDSTARGWQVRLLLRAVRNQMGSAARHLLRLGICLHGIQMIGCGDQEVPEEATEDGGRCWTCCA